MKISGIYKIQSLIKPERFYIGSSIDIKKRWTYHRRDLRGNKHCNIRLQNHYNKYGENDLCFSILLGCDKEAIYEHEQYFIDALNPSFNISKIARDISQINVGRKHTKEHNLKIAKAQEGENNSMYGREPWIKGKHIQSKFKGKKNRYSKETLDKMSISNKRAWDLRKSKKAA